MNPVLAFVIVFILLMVALIKFKVSPPVGLFTAAIVIGLAVQMDLATMLNGLASGFGSMMTSIGLLIIFGGIIGDMLGESGATEELAKGMVRLVGRKNDLLALNLVGFIISIPIYFGTAFIMTAPLVKALQKISNKSMKGYVIAIFTGLLLTHCCVAPTPGPLAVAGAIGANVGWFILWGIVICIIPSLLVGWLYGEFVVRKEASKETAERKAAFAQILNDDSLVAPDPNRPSAMCAFLLILFPIVLIIFGSVVSLFVSEGVLYNVATFLGNNNVALFLGMLVTGFVLRRYLAEKGYSVMKFIDVASDRTGGILLIVGTGGSLATILSTTGIGDQIVEIMQSMHMPMLVLAFLLAMIIRAAVGSGTVAMLTSVSIIGTSAVAMGYSPVIAGLAICLGSVAGTFPTDAVFWFPEKYNGLNTKECVATTTLPNIAAAIIGFGILMILQAFSSSLPGMF